MSNAGTAAQAAGAVELSGRRRSFEILRGDAELSGLRGPGVGIAQSLAAPSQLDCDKSSCRLGEIPAQGAIKVALQVQALPSAANTGLTWTAYGKTVTAGEVTVDERLQQSVACVGRRLGDLRRQQCRPAAVRRVDRRRPGDGSRSDSARHVDLGRRRRRLHAVRHRLAVPGRWRRDLADPRRCRALRVRQPAADRLRRRRPRPHGVRRCHRLDAWRLVCPDRADRRHPDRLGDGALCHRQDRQSRCLPRRRADDHAGSGTSSQAESGRPAGLGEPHLGHRRPEHRRRHRPRGQRQFPPDLLGRPGRAMHRGHPARDVDRGDQLQRRCHGPGRSRRKHSGHRA